MKLKHVCSLYGDYGLNISADEYVEDGVPIIRTSDFDDLGRLDLTEPKRVSESAASPKMLRRGDILFSRAGTIGRCTTYNRDSPATFAAYLVRFRLIASLVEPRFIAWWAQSQQYWSQVRVDTIESTIGNFNAGKLGNLALPDVPRDEQKAIADFLDRETARIDQLIEKKQRLLEVLNATRVAAPLRVMASGMGEIEYDADHNRINFSNLGEGWQRVRVKHVASHMTSGSRGWSDFIQDDGELFLQSGSINRHMGIAFEDSHRVSPQLGAEAERTKVNNGDTLVCITGGRTGAVGYVSRLSERAYINQHVCLIRPSKAINDRLLAQILFSEIGQLHFRMAQYGLKQGMGFEQVANTAIPLPPRAAQETISAEIDCIAEKTRRVVEEIDVSINRLREFRAALITAAVTGQIDVTSWGKTGSTDRRLDEIEVQITNGETVL
ncbi:MAG: restriction endonuclease subunit S [Roseibium sp.]|uniref:restriction endonuclease subunit S n=1 Tax=Alphaproteobacteria TaxID=28211 RepID=UPI00329A36DB